MQFSREDCASLSLKNFGYSVLCAKIIDKKESFIGIDRSTAVLEDSSGKITVAYGEDQHFEIGEIAYFLFNCSEQPLTAEVSNKYF
jgi:hypothetical protein